MAIVGSTWSAALFGALNSMGFTGSRLMEFTDAVGNGSQAHVVGKTFATVDVGTIPGAGVGVGTGVVSINDPLVSTTIFSTALGTFGQFGNRLQDTCDAIAATLVGQMANADLNSTHSPVFAGSGTIVPGSIPVVGPAWGAAIQAAAPAFIGSQWGNYANAIGVGCAAGFATATGTVTISGSPAGTPSGGGGSGSGVIS